MASGSEGSSRWRKVDATGTPYATLLSGTTQAAFPDAGVGMGENAIRERVISNPGNATFYVNIFGDLAVASGAGTIPVSPGQTVYTEAMNAMTVIGTAGQPITLGER